MIKIDGKVVIVLCLWYGNIVIHLLSLQEPKQIKPQGGWLISYLAAYSFF